MIDDITTEIIKITVHALARASLCKEILKLEKDTTFPIGFYKGLREHGIFVHRLY